MDPPVPWPKQRQTARGNAQSYARGLAVLAVLVAVLGLGAGQAWATGTRSTSATVSCIPIIRQVGQATTCTATVTDTATGAAITPTGTVSFSSDTSGGTFSNGGSCTLSGSGASASCSVTYTPGQVGSGTHTIQVLYFGDADHAPNTNSNNSAQITVTAGGSARQTSTSVSCTPAPVAVGQSTTCTATVSDISPGASSTPTGTVSFSSDTSGGTFSNGGSCTLTGSGASASCSVTYTPSQVGSGTHQITASYSGDATHTQSSASAPVGVLAANLPASVTSVSCSPGRVLIGQPTTCTATVTDAGPGTPVTPTGQVLFSSDGRGDFQTPGGCTLAAIGPGQASCQLTYTPTAINPFTLDGPSKTDTRTITAAYQGGSHNPSQGFTRLASSLRPTTTSLSCTPGSVTIGQRSTCTATVTDTAPGARTAPSGPVRWGVSVPGELTSSQLTNQGARGHNTDTCQLAPTGARGVSACQLFFTPLVPGQRVLDVGFGGNDGGLTDNPGPPQIGDQHARSSARTTVNVFGGASALADAQGCLNASAASVASSPLPGGPGGTGESGGVGAESTNDLASHSTIPTNFPVVDPGSLDASAVASGPLLSSGLAVRLRLIKLAGVHRRFGSTGLKHVRLTLNSRARRLVRTLARRHRGFSFTLIFRFTPADGGPVQVARHKVTIHARRPGLLVFAHNHTSLGFGQPTVLHLKLTTRARKLLRQADRRHKTVRLLFFVRIINPGGQTVLAYRTITLPPGHGAHAKASDLIIGTVTSCNPVPGPGIPTQNLSSEQQTVTDAAQRAQITQGQAQELQVEADANAAPNTLSPGARFDSGIIGSGRLDSSSGLITFAPPGPFHQFSPNQFDPSALAVGPSLSGGLPT